MTEKLNVSDGRLKVERVEGKESLDIDLSTVESVRFEASQFVGYPGALVLVVDGEEKVVRVDNDDADDVLKQVYATNRSEAPAGEVNEAEEPKEAPASEDAAQTPTKRRSQRS